MTEDALSREVALRIGLAARALPDMDATRLIRILDECIERPFSEDKLYRLTPKRLRIAAGGLLSDIDAGTLRQAVRWLRGEEVWQSDRAASAKLQPLGQGEMPNSIRVAVASNGGERLDGHFGSCARFLVYQVSTVELRLVDMRPVNHTQSTQEGNISFRVSLIADCHLVCTVSIGGPAAAKVIKAGIHPLKRPEGGEARNIVATLQPVLAGSPPPWLAKVMGVARSGEHPFRARG
jgi:nitrogen fixation protein NifX